MSFKLLRGFQRRTCAPINLMLVLQQLILSSEAYHDNNYRQTHNLGPNGSFVVESSLEGKTVIFHINAATTGYIGFGVNKQGLMTGSDIIIGGVTPDGKPYFDDAHVEANRSVRIDQQQDWKLVAAWEKEGRTYLTIKRPFDTCDPDDIAITKDLLFLIWAYGDTDEVIYHMKRRGSAPIYLLDPMIGDQIANDHYRQIGPHSNLYLVQRWALTTGTIKLEPKPTTVLCNIQRGPRLLARHDIVGMGAYLPTRFARKHVRQIRIFKCTPPPQVDVISFFETFTKASEECFLNENRTLPLPFCRELIYVWGRGGKPFYFPEDIGIPIGLSQTEYFLLETTYDNSKTARNLEIEAGVEIIFSHRQKPNSASLIQVGYGTFGTFIIPPKATMNIHGSCGSSCTSLMFPKDGVKVFAAMLQTRSLGRSVHLQHFRHNQELKYILKDENNDSEYQQMRLLKNETLLLPGDQITTHCFYNSWGRNRTTFSGFSTQDETCTGYMYISKQIPFFQCTSEIKPEKILAKYFGIYNFTWDLIWQERYVTQPKELEGTWLGDVVDHKSQRQNRNVERIQAEYYTPHFQSCPSIGDIMISNQNKLYQTRNNDWRMDDDGWIDTETPYLSSQEVSYPRNVQEYQDAPHCGLSHQIHDPSIPESAEPPHPVPKPRSPSRRPSYSIPESADPHIIPNRIISPTRKPSQNNKSPFITELADLHNIPLDFRRIPPTRRPSIPESQPQPSPVVEETLKPQQQPLVLEENPYPKSIEDLSTDVFQQLFLKSLEEELFRAAQHQNRNPNKNVLNDDQGPPLIRSNDIHESEDEHESQPRLKSHSKKKNKPKRVQNRPSYHSAVKDQLEDQLYQPATPSPTLESYEDQFNHNDEHYTSEKPELNEDFFGFPASKPTSKPVDVSISMRTRRPKVLQYSDVDPFLNPGEKPSPPIIDQQQAYVPQVLRRPTPGPRGIEEENEQFHKIIERPRELSPQPQPYRPQIRKRPISNFKEKSRVEQPRVEVTEQPNLPISPLKVKQQPKPRLLKRPVFDFEIPEQPPKALGRPSIPNLEEQQQVPRQTFTPHVQRRPTPTFDENELPPIKASLQRPPPLSPAFREPTLQEQQPNKPYIPRVHKRPNPTFDEYEQLPPIKPSAQRPPSSPPTFRELTLQDQRPNEPYIPRVQKRPNPAFNEHEQLPRKKVSVQKPTSSPSTFKEPKLEDQQPVEPYIPRVQKRPNPAFDEYKQVSRKKVPVQSPLPPSPNFKNQQSVEPYIPRVQKRPNPTFNEYEQLPPKQAFVQRPPPPSPTFKEPTLRDKQPVESYNPRVQKRPTPTFDEYEQLPPIKVSSRIPPSPPPTFKEPTLKDQQPVKPYIPRVQKRPNPTFDEHEQQPPIKVSSRRPPPPPTFKEPTLKDQQPDEPYIPRVQKRPNPTFDEYEQQPPIKASSRRPPPPPPTFKEPTLEDQELLEPYIPRVQKRPNPTFNEYELPSIKTLPQRPPPPLSQRERRPTLPQHILDDNNPFEVPLLPTLKEQESYKPQGQRRPIQILEEAERFQRDPASPHQQKPVSFFDESMYKGTTQKPELSKPDSRPYKNHLERPSLFEFVKQPHQSKPYKPNLLRRPNYLPDEDLHSREAPPTSTPTPSPPRGQSVPLFDDFPPSRIKIYKPIPPSVDADLPHKNKPIIRRPTIPKLEEDSYLTGPEKPIIPPSFDGPSPFSRNAQPTPLPALPAFDHDVQTKAPLRRPQYTSEPSDEQPPSRSKTQKINSGSGTKRPTPLPSLPSNGDGRPQKTSAKIPQPAVHYIEEPIYRNPVRNPLVTPLHNNNDDDGHYELSITNQKPKSVLDYLNDVEKKEQFYNDNVGVFHQDQIPNENSDERESYYLKKNSQKKSKVNYSDITRVPPQKPKQPDFDKPRVLKRPTFQYSDVDIVQQQKPQPTPSPQIRYSEPDRSLEKIDDTPGRVFLSRPSPSLPEKLTTIFIRKQKRPASYHSDTSGEVLSKRQQKSKEIKNKKEEIPKKPLLPIFESLIPTIPPISQVSFKEKFDLKKLLKNSIFNKQSDITIPLIEKDKGSVKDNKSILKFFEQLANIFSPGSKSKEHAKEMLKTLESTGHGVSFQNIERLNKRRGEDERLGSEPVVPSTLPTPPPKKKTTRKPTTNNIKLLIVKPAN